MIISNIVLIVFITYLVCYLLIIIYIAKKTEEYLKRTTIISDLGVTTNPFGYIFKVTTIFYGIISLAIPFRIYFSINNSVLSFIGIIALITTSISIVLAGYYSMDKNLKLHKLGGTSSFTSVTLATSIFLLISLNNKNLPIEVAYISILSLIVTIAFSVHYYFFREERNYATLEWLSFYGTIMWYFFLALVLIRF